MHRLQNADIIETHMTAIMLSVLTTLVTKDINTVNRVKSDTDGESGLPIPHDIVQITSLTQQSTLRVGRDKIFILNPLVVEYYD